MIVEKCIHSRRYVSKTSLPLVDMDPEQNTVDDLMLRICFLENVGNSKGVCLYTVDGMPLTDDPLYNTCKNTFNRLMSD